MFRLLLCNPLGIIAPWPENGALVDPQLSAQCITDYFRTIIAFKSHIRVDTWACINGFGTSDSRHYHDSRSGMSVVTFRTAPPIGGLSCLISVRWNYNIRLNALCDNR